MSEASVFITPAKPRRRWFQFSLRTFVVGMIALSVFIAWWSRSALRQKEAVEAIEAGGGKIRYDFERQKPSGQKSPIPEPILNFFGVDFFHNVVGATLDSQATSSSTDMMKHLPALFRLKTLALRRSDLKNEDLRSVGRCSRLEWLDITQGWDVSDEGIRHLGALGHLKSLSLRQVRLGKDAGEVIARLRSLKDLSITESELNTEALVQIGTMHQLESLNLMESDGVTDDGVAQLADLTNLVHLNLIDAKQVSDDGLKHLSSLRNLRTLRLFLTKVTATGREQLQPSMPACTISITVKRQVGDMTYLEASPP